MKFSSLLAHFVLHFSVSANDLVFHFKIAKVLPCFISPKLGGVLGIGQAVWVIQHWGHRDPYEDHIKNWFWEKGSEIKKGLKFGCSRQLRKRLISYSSMQKPRKWRQNVVIQTHWSREFGLDFIDLGHGLRWSTQ